MFRKKKSKRSNSSWRPADTERAKKGEADSDTVRMLALVIVIFGMLAYWIVKYFVLR